ncbi:hypothetical protein [Streptomyces graminilatus]|uniref:hypothetical protein n=1 Tax=Streptomyces graminilatus TaxID=1464070 RepID=UPI0006E2BB96|nr:hypothetical protein [Streptomyces graminilatus]
MLTGAWPIRSDVLASKKVPKGPWIGSPADRAPKTPSVHDWTLVATADPSHHLMVRRSIADPIDLSYFYAYTPEGRSIALADLVAVAGIRWTAEEDFANGKDTVGLDHTQARRHRSWRRHVVLAMATLALLSVIAGLDRREHPAPIPPAGTPTKHPRTRAGRPDRHRGPPACSTCFTHLPRNLPATRRMTFHLQGSAWRRRHQARARRHRYERRLTDLD